MCGIIGFGTVNKSNSSIYQNWIRKGIKELAHRGPDDEGIWHSNDFHVGLGHKRLAIIDLSPSGHQPMTSSDQDYCIVFNGEIYNFKDIRSELKSKGHVFRKENDTEVVLHSYMEWGNDCTSHFNGMFAFAVYDVKKNKLLLFRDRAGEKPLFYYEKNGTLLFASELKAILRHKEIIKASINLTALDCYLSMGFIPGDLCIIKDVKKLPAAHWLEFDLGTSEKRVTRYWKLPDYNEKSMEGQLNEKELLDELEMLLEDSVKRQMVSDVPLGILLSGGVDSSLVTAMAARSGNQIRTYTVSFPKYSKFDEKEYAGKIADYFNTEHTVLEVDEINHELLIKLAAQYDEPIIDSSMIPTFLVSRMIKQHCTVALGGDGGDELFGGYGHYSRLISLKSKLKFIPSIIGNRVSYLAGQLLPVGFKGRVWFQSLGENLETSLPKIASYFDPATRRNLLGVKATLDAENIWNYRIPKNSDLIQRATRMDFENYMVEDILVKVDRASMLNSLEIRAPFLDYRIIEFAFGKVPTYLKTTPDDKKILLKKLTERVLPKDFDKKRKQGFSIPIGEWLRKGEWNTFIKDVLLDSGSQLFNKTAMEKLIRNHERGYNNTERLFGLLMLHLWAKEYDCTIG